MFRNYMKIAFRNLRKNKGFSVINIAGLAIGMACCILILMYVKDELSYDTYNVNIDRIYRVNALSSIGATTRYYATTPPALAPELANVIPEVVDSVRIFDGFELQGKIQDNNIIIPDVYIVDPGYFDIFTHRFTAGRPEAAMENPDSIILTVATARRLFGDKDPLGQAITLNQQRELQVSGVIEDVPKYSHFRFNGIIPSHFMRDNEGRPAGVLTADYFCEVYSYLLVREDTDIPALAGKIADTAESTWGEMYKERGTTRKYPLQKLRDIHLRSTWEYELGTPGDINNVYLFSAVALFVLFIACFNFINLSTARSANRAREVGMRKVFGSQKNQLVKQFISESIILSLFSLFLGIILVISVLPVFNSLSGKEFAVKQLTDPVILFGFLGIIILCGFIAGSFPAFILSAFHPIQVLRGKLSSASKNSTLRRMLVIFQFAISVFLIIGILTMIQQLNFMKNKDLGFNKDQLVLVPFFGAQRDEEATRRYTALRERILQNPNVTDVSFSAQVPGQELGFDAYLPEGNSNDETFRASCYWVDYDFINTYGIELVWGRDFSREFSTDAQDAIIINEKAAEGLDWGKDAVGKRIFNVARDMRPGRIVGVVKDFHNEGLKMEISPVVLRLDTRFFGFVSARIRADNVAETLGFLETTLREVSREVRPNREFNFNYYFIDEDFRNKYPEEEKLREIYLIFGGLAIFIACLGLFGLASYTVEQRTKEIGVRKVLGATVREIVTALTKEFSKWVLIANLLAWPLAYYAMHRWLQNFAYRIGISWQTFVFATVAAFIIAVLTVSYHSIRAGLANPVDSLRYE